MARRTKTQAEHTHARVLGAARLAFAENGVRATTLEHVAAHAGVSRGAVYWHFSDKAALVAAAFATCPWPLDIGADLSAYGAHPWPLHLLRDRLWTQVAGCLQDPQQWGAVKLALRHGEGVELQADARDSLTRRFAAAVGRLVRVMELADAQGQLRADLSPVAAGQCLHAVGIGVLSHYAERGTRGDDTVGPRCLDLFLRGASSTGALRSAAPA